MGDFDDGYGDPSDYGMSQQNFDDASAVGAQTYQDNQNNQNQQFGIGSGDGIDSSEGNIRDPSIGFGNDTYRQFSDDMLQNYLRAGSVNPYSSLNALNNFSGGAGDYGIDGSRMGLNTALANLYTKERGASDINPYPEGPFGTDTIFGKVNFAKSLGKNRVQEINDLRARQAFGLPSLKTGKDYTGRDYYDGQETVYGTARPLPMGGLETLVNMMPGISGVKALFGGGRKLPPNHPEMIRLRAEAQAEANKPGILDRIESGLSNFGTDVYNSFSETGGAIGDFLTNMITKSDRYIGDKFTGSNLNSGIFSAEPKKEDFDQFSTTRDNRQIEDFENRVDIPDFRTNPNVDNFKEVGNFPIIDPVNVGIEQLGSMNPDGQYGDAAGSLFKRTNLDNYTSPNFTKAEIDKMYDERFGPQKTARTETFIPEIINKTNSDSIYPPGTTSKDLDSAAQAYLSLSRDDKMKMDFPTFYSQFKK